MSVWRVGFHGAPCDFTPHHLCGWNHRYDDPKREYRTVYCADAKETCLREVLVDLRPSEKTLADYRSVFGEDEALASAGRVTAAWRERHVLARAELVVAGGHMVDIESPPVLAGLGTRLGEPALDSARVRGKDRNITRAASRLLFEDGAAGIDFRSRLDGGPCHALFEGRARLEQLGEPLSLVEPLAELRAVCAELGLTL